MSAEKKPLAKKLPFHDVYLVRKSNFLDVRKDVFGWLVGWGVVMVVATSVEILKEDIQRKFVQFSLKK